MFKKTSERLSHMERVASHATKEHASGRIDMIPTDAQQPVDYFNDLHDQYKSLNANYQLLMAEAAMLRRQLKQRMSYDEFRRIEGQSNAVGQMMHHIQQRLADLRPSIRDARRDATGAFKWHLAKEMLRQAEVEHINKQSDAFVAEILKVSSGLKLKSTGEKEGASHVTRAKANKQSLHRRKAHRAIETAKREGLVMYDGGEYRQGDEPLRRTLTLPVEEMAKKLADHFNKR